MTKSDHRFELDYSGLASLVMNYPVEDDHSAMLAIEAALPGTADRPLISGPCEMAVDLLADGDGEIDGYRIIIRPNDTSPWLATHIQRVSYLEQWDDPTDPGDLYDTAQIIELAVQGANELLEWSRR